MQPVAVFEQSNAGLTPEQLAAVLAMLQCSRTEKAEILRPTDIGAKAIFEKSINGPISSKALANVTLTVDPIKFSVQDTQLSGVLRMAVALQTRSSLIGRRSGKKLGAKQRWHRAGFDLNFERAHHSSEPCKEDYSIEA